MQVHYVQEHILQEFVLRGHGPHTQHCTYNMHYKQIHLQAHTCMHKCTCVQSSSKRAPPLLGYHSLASMYLCTEVFKESTPIATVPLSCLNVSVYRVKESTPHCWGTTLSPQCICVQRSLKSTPIAGVPLSCLNVSVYRGL